MPGAQHGKIVLSGIFGPVAQPFEIFSFGISVDTPGDFGPAKYSQLVAACATYFGDPRNQISNALRLTEVSYSVKAANGIQIGETVRNQVDQRGGASDMCGPPQVAVRVSIDSGLRGRSQKGGWYLPGVIDRVDPASGLMSVTQADNTAASAVDFIAALKAAGAGPVIVASKVAGNVTVHRVRVGRAYDTIRRRRNGLPEAYSSLPVPS